MNCNVLQIILCGIGQMAVIKWTASIRLNEFLYQFSINYNICNNNIFKLKHVSITRHALTLFMIRSDNVYHAMQGNSAITRHAHCQ